MKNTNTLDKRMKVYEHTYRYYLTKKIPAIIRLDGKNFHTFCKGLTKPFDLVMMKSMQDTAKYLCENIQGCKVAYVQSDEITLLLTDYDQINTDGWFDYNIQKMISVSASMATLAFNQAFKSHSLDYIVKMSRDVFSNNPNEDLIEIARNKKKLYESKYNKALFDSRAFSLPKEEICNNFIWRQQDAIRNSIQMVGQTNFSHKQLQGKSCNDIQDILMEQKGINWNDLPVTQKRGSCIIKKQITLGDNKTIRNKWIVDDNIPIFSKDRDYIDKFVFI